MSGSLQEFSSPSEKLKLQNDEMEALLRELTNVGQVNNGHISEFIDELHSPALKQPAVEGASVEGSSNRLIDWEKKYDELVIIRKNYQKRNGELKIKRDNVLASVEHLREEYHKVQGEHDAYCNHGCNCYSNSYRSWK